MDLKKYINKYDMKRIPDIDIYLGNIFLKYDYNEFNYTFTISKESKIFRDIKHLYERVSQTKEFLSKEEFSLNLKNYFEVINKIEKELPFSIYTGKDNPDYFRKNILAIEVFYLGEKYILLKNQIANWFAKIEQYVVYTNDYSICLRICNNYKKLFFSFNQNVKNYNDYCKHLYTLKPKNIENTCYPYKKVLSQESFKIVDIKNGKKTIVSYRIQKHIKNLEIKINDSLIYERIKFNNGIKCLESKDYDEFKKLLFAFEYQKLKNNHLLGYRFEE